MTFAEMVNKYDSFGAYSDFMTIEHANTIGLYPAHFNGTFPEKCSCGSDMIINVSMTKLTCCDPRCRIKQALALSELFSRFNYKGVADAVCTSIYNTLQFIDKEAKNRGEAGLFSTDSYLEVLLLDESKIPYSIKSTAAGEEFLNGIKYMRSQVLTFPEMVSKLGLPEFDTTAYKLFSDFSSIDELLAAIRSENGVNNFCENRGVHALQKKFWLYASLQDIFVASVVFQNNLRRQGLSSLNICITGSLTMNNSRVTKSEFINICNEYGFTRCITDILQDALSSYAQLTAEQMEKISKLIGYNINYNNEDTISTKKLLENLQANELPSIQLYEVRMTTAKKSVPYIVADTPSNSAKYLEGLRRGEEYDEDGIKHKVLVSSKEMLAIIKDKVNLYEKELIQQCQNLLKTTQDMTIF